MTQPPSAPADIGADDDTAASDGTAERAATSISGCAQLLAIVQATRKEMRRLDLGDASSLATAVDLQVGHLHRLHDVISADADSDIAALGLDITVPAATTAAELLLRQATLEGYLTAVMSQIQTALLLRMKQSPTSPAAAAVMQMVGVAHSSPERSGAGATQSDPSAQTHPGQYL